MHTNLARLGPRDPSNVNIDEYMEVEYWCEKFGCTEEELRTAVREAGTLVPRVRQKIHVLRVLRHVARRS